MAGFSREELGRALLLGGLNTISTAGQPGANTLGSVASGISAGLGGVFQGRLDAQRQKAADAKAKLEQDYRNAQIGALQAQTQNQNIQAQQQQQQFQQQQQQNVQQQQLQQARAQALNPLLQKAQQEQGAGGITPQTQAELLGVYQNPDLQFQNPAKAFENTFGYNPNANQAAKPTSLQQNLTSAGLTPGTPEFKKAVLANLTKPANVTKVSVGQGPSYVQTKGGLLIDKNNPDQVQQYNESVKQQHDAAVESKINEVSGTLGQLDAAEALVKDPSVLQGSDVTTKLGNVYQSYISNNPKQQEFEQITASFQLMKAALQKGAQTEYDAKRIASASFGPQYTKDANLASLKLIKGLYQKQQETAKKQLFNKPSSEAGSGAGLSGLSNEQLLQMLQQAQ